MSAFDRNREASPGFQTQAWSGSWSPWTVPSLMAISLLLPTPLIASDPIQLHWKSKTWIGDPLFVSSRQVLLVGRDGQLREFPGTDETRVERLDSGFEPFSSTELRDRLRREFRGFEITITPNYVVVHPVGQAAIWSTRFEELLVEFQRYFIARGAKIHEPRFPLVAIVLRNREEFLEYGRQKGDPVDPSLIGYYSAHTNRIALYDVTQGTNEGDRWAKNAGTIYHEAAHQAAFNVGIHHRFSPPPRWVSEGLGAIFESPALWHPTGFVSADTLGNQRMLQALESTSDGTAASLDLNRLLTDDDWFDVDPAAAYSRAWALSRYLSETQPQAYTAYLQRTAAKRPFHRTTQEERLADWRQDFPHDLEQLERQVWQFLDGQR